LCGTGSAELGIKLLTFEQDYLEHDECSEIRVGLLSYLSYIAKTQRKAFYSTVSAN